MVAAKGVLREWYFVCAVHIFRIRTQRSAGAAKGAAPAFFAANFTDRKPVAAIFPLQMGKNRFIIQYYTIAGG